MHPGGNPFEPQGPDPFGAPPGPAYTPPIVGQFGSPPPGGPPYPPPPKRDYNTFAVLSPVFAVMVPPAGVALGHLALPQIRRTGERGRRAALAGIALGYLMCAVLIAAAIWWATADSGSDADSAATTTPTARPSTTRPRPSVITSVAPPTAAPRIKLDLATVAVGTCVEIQLRSDRGDDALDLYKVDCASRDGIYTVTDRVATNAQCRSVYVAAPPDHTFAVCLNPYR